MKAKRNLSRFLSLFLVAILLFSEAPFAVLSVSAKASDAYATVFSASDFQSDSCYSNLTAMMKSAINDGITAVPDAFLFGGDYTGGSEDPAIQVPKVTDTVLGVYPGYDEDNLIYTQGNHDSANSVMTATGFYEFDDFVVYSVNEDDFRASQAGVSGYGTVVQNLAQEVEAELKNLKETGDSRPVFFITHVPLHHSSRYSYGDNLYSKYLFDVLNEYGKELDIIFLFGHNHSNNYDDYIGGAVNYIAKGENIRIPVPDTAYQGENGYTDETLNFTYMNCGYVGYSSNGTSGGSTNTLTMSAFEICPTTIEITRYTTTGVYSTETVTRNTPLVTDHYVSINGSTTGVQGNSDVFYGVIANIENATCTWTSSDESVAQVYPAGQNAYVVFKGEGTAELNLSVTDDQGSVYTASHTVTVSSSDNYSPSAVLNYKNSDVNGIKLKFYDVSYGDTIMLDGSFTGFGNNANNIFVLWTSSDPAVATVENGYVTFASSGETTISYVVSDGKTTLTNSVIIFVSRAAKPSEIFFLTDNFEAGKSYIIANTSSIGSAYIMSMPSFTAASTTEKYNIRMTAATEVIEEIDGKASIMTDNDLAVWNAVSDGNGGIYLVNDKYNQYLYSQYDANREHQQLGVTTDPTHVGTLWHINSDGHIVSNMSDMSIQFSSALNFRSSPASSVDEQFIFEKTVSTPHVSVKDKNAVMSGTTQTIYSVDNETERTVKGYYSNFGEDVVVKWISSDTSIATVNDGLIKFTGNPGIVDITYCVSDAQGNLETAVITYDVKLTKEPVRVFRMTDKIEAGKNYVVVSGNSVGASYMMSGEHRDDTTLLQEYVVIQPDTSDDSVYIEVKPDNTDVVWTAEATDKSGAFYFKNESDGTYLWAKANADDFTTAGTLSTSAAIGEYANYGWSYSGSGVYCQENFTTDGTMYFSGIRRSGSNYYRNAKPVSSDPSNVFLYEETELEPFVHLRSRYVCVEDNVISRAGICVNETEDLLAFTVNFPNDSYVMYSWTSSDTSVASVDSEGMVTYTGKSGTTVITVTATSIIPDSDGNYPTALSKVTITVPEQQAYSADTYILTDNFTAGKYYLFSPSMAAGKSVIMSGTKVTTSSSEHYLKGTNCVIEQKNEGMVISCFDENNVWECIQSPVKGYYHFRNVKTGEYLAFVYDYDYEAYRRVTTSASLNEYSSEAYLIKANTSKNQILSSLSEANSNRLTVNSANNFRLTSNADKIYIYESLDEEMTVTTVQIRVNDFFGSSDISNVLQNRYNVKHGDTEQLLNYTRNILDVSSVQWSVSDESIAVVDENGLLVFTGRNGFVTVSLTVTGKDINGETVTQTVETTFNASTNPYETPTEDYPQYPYEGSVRINKTASNDAGGYNFQTSGVTEVELAVTGVPLPQAVDVVIVFDHSSSMNSYNRLKNAISDTREFALQIVNSNTSNRVAIVTFDRYRENYQNFNSALPNYSTDITSNEDRIITGDGTPEGAFMSVDHSAELISQIDSLQYNSIQGTNYDYGLKQCYDILKASKTDPNANKKQYVVFMSDGEPFVFNRLYINYGTKDPDGAFEAWLRGDSTNETLNSYIADSTTYPAAQYFNPRGENWFAESIKAEVGTNISDMPAVDYYNGYSEGLGATLFTIGYGAGEPGSLTSDILSNMASKDDYFYYAESNLQQAYDSILSTIVHAANNAVVTDKMGENFNLQFSSAFTLNNGMATITLDPAPKIEIGAWTLNSDGTRNTYSVHETITFETNSSGALTAAYSSLLSDNIYDAASSVLNGKYVSYDILKETFTWNIDDITRDEITLKYYAYLEGAAEGERNAGIYDTNEYAYLTYINYIGNECIQYFPVPSKGWKIAAVNYEYYLVNEKGEPINKDGIVVPFTERVLVGQEQTKELYLNSSEAISSYTLGAAAELPDGYTLFNPATTYSVSVSSGDNPSKAVINDDTVIHTTYFRDGTLTYYGHGEVPGVTDYTNTHVSFAVLFIEGILPDEVVIDYGLPVKINVLLNDFIKSENGKLNAVGTQLNGGTILNSKAYSSSQLVDGTNSVTLENGVATVSGEQIVYTPANMKMSDEEVFYYEFVTSDGMYFYTTVTVIPAANIYYEDSFFTFTDSGNYKWQTEGETYADKFQDEDRPGTFSFANADANNVYGRDSAYDDTRITHSLGSAKFASVDAASINKEPTSEFTFCGTGFDLFSVTNSDTGAVIVAVYDVSTGKRVKNYIVHTYYGYGYDSENNQFVPDTSSGENGLYQVPVIRSRDLGYGTYRVVITPKYLKAFDMKYDENAENNAYEVYVDAVRIYDPAGVAGSGDMSDVAADAYIRDKEYDPVHAEVKKSMIDANTFYDSVYTLPDDTYSQGVVFIDGIADLSNDGLKPETDSLLSDTYKDAGPNNELYLAKGQAIAFHVMSDRAIEPESLQLGIKTVGQVSDVTQSNLLIMNTAYTTPSTVTIMGGTEMFMRLTPYLVWDEDALEQGIYKTKYPVVIVNTSDTIVSLTNFKWTYSEASSSGQQGLMFAVTPSTPEAAVMAFRRYSAPVQDDTFNPENMNVEWNSTELVEGAEAIVTITTPVDIVCVAVDGNEVTDCEIDDNGNKKWTFTFVVTETGEHSYSIVFADKEGNISDALMTETIYVDEAPETPDNDNTDNEASNLIENFLERLVSFILRLIEFWRALL